MHPAETGTSVSMARSVKEMGGYLGMLVGSQNLVHSLLTQQVVLEIVCVLAAAGSRGGIHPF